MQLACSSDGGYWHHDVKKESFSQYQKGLIIRKVDKLKPQKVKYRHI